MADETRFRVRYRLRADTPQEADQRALGIALEQTVEIPGDIVPEGYISDEIVGQIEAVRMQAAMPTRRISPTAPTAPATRSSSSST
jgi:hypothetical protein